MTPTEICNAVCTLQAKGHSLREISRSLALSRNTVRRILRQPKRTADETAPCDDAEIERAEHEAIAAPELLYRLLSQEAASRQERSLAYRLRQAHLPWRWSLETFPFDRQPGVSKAQIQTLAGLDFLRRADNILFIGKPGTGKTGLAMGFVARGVSQRSPRPFL